MEMNGPDMPTREKISFRYIKKNVLARIRDNTWAPDTIIPNEVDLAEEFGCSRATVNRAMRELAEEGIIDRKRRTGTRVNAAPVRSAKLSIPLVRDEVETTGASYRYALVSRAVMTAPDWLRARLDLPLDSRVLRLQCMHYADNAPFQFEDRWINIATVPEVEKADFTEVGPNEWLLAQVPFSDVELSFTAVAADAELAPFLSMTTGEPVFTAERATWLNGNPVTFARMSFARGYRMTTRF